MKRVLFVDDEPEILRAIENVLFAEESRFDAVFVDSGEAALRALDENTKDPFEVVITDMRVPGMNGADLLARVRQHYPETIRVILTGYSELDDLLRAIPVAHQFLSKPVTAAALLDVINTGLHRIRRLQDEHLMALVNGIDALPARPHVYQALQSRIKQQDADFGNIAEIISEDVAISAKVLQVANTVYFAARTPVDSVTAAVRRLGLSIIADLVFTVEAFRVFSPLEKSGFPVEAFHAHSLRVARIAQELSKGMPFERNAFLAASLHDVGKLIFATVEPEIFERLLYDTVDDRPDVVREFDAFGADHAQVGGYLLDLWGLPASIVTAVTSHHNALDSGLDSLGTLIRIADELACEEEGSLPAHARAAERSTGYPTVVAGNR